MKKFFFIYTFVIVAIISCNKEYSFENPLGNNGSIIIGNNCIINRITDFDTLGNRGASAFNYTFNTNGTLLTNLVQFDSITSSVILSKTLTKSMDTLFIDANQFFIIDTANANRVKQLVAYENPYFAGSTIFIYNYIYNASGKLITKTQKNPFFPAITITQTDYAYTGNNLTGVTSKIPLTNTTFFTATINFELSSQPKNYLYFFPEANEALPYVGAANYGSKNSNAPTKVICKNYNQLTGVFIDSTVTEYSKYKYSTDGYVLSVDASGFALPSLPLINGRNKFGYFCR